MTDNGLDKGWEPKIVSDRLQLVHLCGGGSRRYQPDSVSAERRGSSGFPARAGSTRFTSSRRCRRGRNGVLVSGCHPGECHYITGNLIARRKFAALKSFLNYIGVEGDRTLFTWVSASEGDLLAQAVRGVTDAVRALGPAHKLVKNLPGTEIPT